MTKIKPGNYLFVHYGYDGEPHAPQLTLLADDTTDFLHLAPRGQMLTLQFDKSQRFCGGWHDLATAISYPCPEKSKLPSQYNQCRHCQNKTGFNPAFYHSASVSAQQTARNQQPHTLYLAHFAPGVTKVGITWAERGIKRLLDQGARSCLIVKTYPNADLARHYEAKIAKLPGIAETIQVKVKHKLLATPYDAKQGTNELEKTRLRLIDELGITPEENSPMHLDEHYTASSLLKTTSLLEANEDKISGHCLGMIGSTVLVEQDGIQYILSLSKLTGYRVSLSYDQQEIAHEPQQISLF